MRFRPSIARSCTASLLFLAAASCSRNANPGDILGGMPGSGISPVSGTIADVDTRTLQIRIQQSNGQIFTLSYDNNTQVTFQNQNYPVTSLEFGDEVTARVKTSNTNSGYYTDLIQVTRSVSDAGSVQSFSGVARNIDHQNGTFTLNGTEAGTVKVWMPFNPGLADLNRFKSLREGDPVRLYGILVNNSRVELRQFY